MDCENCYKKSNRLKGRRRCDGDLKKYMYFKARDNWETVCDYFIPNDYLFTWDESLYVEQPLPTFLGKQPPARASHPAKEGRGG